MYLTIYKTHTRLIETQIVAQLIAALPTPRHTLIHYALGRQAKGSQP